jgi:hypothetical protein
MKHSLELMLLLSGLAVFACKNDDDGGDTDTDTENLQPIEGALGKNGRPETPAANRIDRAGRPAISAALISPFTPDDRTADLDRYNKSGNANRAFVPIIEKSLAILDGIDRNCGNQLAAGPQPVAGRYQALATALDDDQLYVRSDRVGAGSVYLGVEAEALGIVPEGQGSGGGRAPGDDVVERSYSVLVAGQFAGIDDGVPRDDGQHDIDVFPFVAAPQGQ